MCLGLKPLRFFFVGKRKNLKEKHDRSCRFHSASSVNGKTSNKSMTKTTRRFVVCQDLQGLDTPNKNAFFFEVLPFTTLAVSVNGKTSKKSVQNDASVFGVSRP